MTKCKNNITQYFTIFPLSTVSQLQVASLFQDQPTPLTTKVTSTIYSTWFHQTSCACLCIRTFHRTNVFKVKPPQNLLENAVKDEKYIFSV